ncbi:hypothetical protein EK904_004374 [Melospiza melodia maxima]|nr:hypothetical protein EK904_004374 [Melospiza melodia maxima]
MPKLFHVAYVLIKFANSPRPDLWVLERSTDFGLTYEPWQYFASSKRDCIEKFGQHTVDRITRDDHAICTTEYSRIVPLENGEIVVSLVNGRPGAMNFSYSPLLRNFTKATNIRLRFLQTNTLLGHLMGKALRDPTVTRRYYYSIKDISIGGRCVCHGHADVCDAKDPNDPYRCHKQERRHAESPAAPSVPDAEACNCNGHAYDCYYDPEVDRHKASRSREDKFEGGGVCIDCQHHTTGINCERCIPGYYRSPDHPIDSPYVCYRCNCDSDFTDGTCEDLTGRCYCKPNYTGEHCHACAEGYLNFPHCYHCDCYAGGTEGNACRKDPRVGMCVCKPNFQGTHCDQCAPGHYGPGCQPCQCSGPGQYDGTCDSDTGQCLCRTGFEGHSCDQCAPGYFNYPLCQSCQCSREGSLHGSCEQDTGQCSCRPGVTGLRCDSCEPGAYGFPHCQVGSCNPAGLETADPSLAPGSCACRAYVEGPACDRCKPGYWNLTPENPYGCLSCKCDTKGTISGITECRQGDGQCFCKANVCGKLCSACKDGYFNMENANYFGCQGCRCDVGGALGPSCEARSGACRCRQGTRGPTCTQPARDHYFPDLHHLKFELEEGTTPSGRAVRFGYNPLEFEGFSWRGYAQMSSIQPKVVVTVNVTSPDLFRLVFRYVSRGPASVQGRVSVLEEGKFNVCANSCPCQASGQSRAWTGREGEQRQAGRQNKIRVTVDVKEAELYLFHVILRYINSGGATVYGTITAYQPRRRGTEQTKQIVFAPSTEPAFVTVPQNSFGEPFVLNPSTWSLVVEAQGVLLDYLVLLPSSYYEAPVLQLKVTEPCVYQPAPEQATQNISEVEVQLSLAVAQPGKHVLLVEYANTNALQSVAIAVSSPHSPTQPATFTFYPCAYSFLCRGIAVDSQSRMATFELTSEATVRFTSDLADFFLHKVYLIPAAQFTMELIEPKVHCISVHGTFSSNSSSCVPSRFLKLSQSIILEGAQALPIPPEVPLAQAVHVAPSGVPVQPAPRPPTAMDPSAELILLQSPQVSHMGLCLRSPVLGQAAVVFSSRIQSLGRYAFILHLYQPSHPSFPVETNASFCPHGYGCRSLVVSEDQTILDVTDNDLTVVVRVPEGKQLWLENVEGPRCDQCRLGTFSLDATNPKGCTKCFCFGATDRCRSAEKHRAEFVDMHGWLLLSSDRHEVPTALSPREQLVTADLKNLPDAYQELYWVAPSSYLGDQVSSYGGHLRYELHSNPRRGDVFIPMESRPDVILKGNFRHTETHNPVSREELMMVLANLEQLQIRALFSQLSSSVSLRRVVLEMATDTATGVRASNVELCLCPANYQGDSCQNCQHNTEGDHCERCKDGYMGSPSAQEPLQCVGCPCPLSVASNNFAVGCVHKGSNMQCLCKPGYAGPNCERVVKAQNASVFLLPAECECRGGSCDPRTGECTCPSGLTGKQCDVCLRQHEVLVANGPDSIKCEVCDSCVLLLLEDLQSIKMSFPSIRGQLVTLNASSIAWARLHGLNGTILAIANQLREYHRAMSRARQRADELEDENMDLTQDLNALQHKMTMTHREAVRVEQHTRDMYQRGEQLLLHIQSIHRGIAELVRQKARIGAENASTTSAEEFRQKLAEVERMLREMKERSLGAQEELARREHEEAKKLLHRVRSELHARWQSNQDLLSSIQERLAQHSSQLMDLRDALNEAQKSQELQKQHALVQEALQMARDALAQVSDFLQMMERAKEAYEKLAALLDGAKLPLTERVKKFSPASSKIPMVEQAEEHARLLDELARNLSGIIQDTNQDGFIQRAVNASNAYASIIEAVRKAEQAAHDADKAASEALMNVISENLGATSRTLKRNSSSLEEAARRQQSKLNGAIKGTLQTAKDKLAGLRVKKEQLLSQLQSVQDMLGREQEDTKDTIQNAKAAAAEANETAARVEDALSTMKKNLDEWKDQYGGLRNEDLNQAVQDARKSVSSLESTIPLLLEKLSSLENRRNKNATVSENIVRIRQLITQARSAASKVKVPMKFNGSSGVQVRMPSNLQDLAAYTSLKFYIQNPEPRGQQDEAEEGRFVLYLGSQEATGDYLGIVLKDRRVHWIYKLGDEEPTSLSVDEDIGEQFVTISINRSKSTGDPWLTDGSYFDGSGYAEIKFESQFGTTKRFEQEIRVVSYNGIIFFLENQADNSDQGTEVGPAPSSAEGQGQFLCLAIRDGKLALYYDFSSGLEMAKPSNSSSLTISSATNKAIQIFLLKMNNKKRILVRVERLTIFVVEQENSLENAVSYYLGGVPPAVLPPSLKSLFPTGGPIRGCMKGLKALGKYVDLKRMNTVGVSYGCTSDLLVARSVSVHGHGYLTLALTDVPGLRDFYSGFSFQTSQPEGLLYHHSTQEGTCQVSLQRGQLALNLLGSEITTDSAYADGRAHYVAFYSDARGLRLYVDDELQDSRTGPGRSRRQRRQEQRRLFHLGGSPEPGALSNISGCIGNVFVKRMSEPQMVVDLQQNVESINVTMSCPIGEQSQQLRVTPKKDRRKHKVPGKPAPKGRRHDQDGLCQLHPQPRTARGSSRFGGTPSSRWEFDEIPASFGWRSHFSLEVKLNSSSGLLFYVAGERGSSMALFVSNGRFVFLLELGGRRLRIRSRDKYRDRRWHTVFFSRDQSRAQLVIDGLRAQGAAVATTGLFVAQSPFYVGGLPAGKAKAHIAAASASSFDGCLRNPQLDGRPLGPPSRTFGVMPCYEGVLESGVFFTMDGGSITLVTKWKNVIQVDVDAEGNHTVGPSQPPAPSTRATFSLGGLPETDKASTGLLLPPLPHYVGCVRNLQINQRHVDLPRAGTARGSVSLKGCPVL